MKDFSSREDRVRTPVSGIRQKLQVALKNTGVISKFRTDHLRNENLVVMSKDFIKLPFYEFEGYFIQAIIRQGY